LAQSIAATVDVPSNDVSAMDGFAVAAPLHSGDVLPVTQVVAAGAPPGAKLHPGTAARIMTGAPIPEHADRVVPVELTSAVESDGALVRFDRTETAGAHIRRRAEVLRCGQSLLEKGEILTPGGLGLLATHGIAEVSVYRPPRVAIATTGNEVVPPSATPLAGQLRDSHTDFLLGACDQMGAETASLGIAPDDPERLCATIAQGLAYDVLILTGGVSMGTFDLVEEALATLGCEPLFDSVAIQPGKPMVAARHASGWVFALPGNPASAMVCFWLFVRPALRCLMGQADRYWHGALSAQLTAPLPATRDRDVFLPGEAGFGRGSDQHDELEVTPLLPKGSHDVSAYARGSLLIRVPAGSEPRAAGDLCSVLPIIDWPHPGPP
jgi:molybdopterin molybdotransferase